jgi:hypothetical protein
MLKKTVYILGAGFSFNAGLPIMANFLDVARDIAIDTDDRELKKTLRYIKDLSSVKNYCESDLFNLEEAFSFFETEDWIKNSSKKHSRMVDLIKKVIKEKTPSAETKELDFGKNEWYRQIYAPKYKSIFCFLSRVFCLKFKKGENKKLIIERMDFKEQNDIITFNYDTLLEDCLKNINKHASEDCRREFNKEVHLYKLHGCVEKNNIVPPTWAKYNTKNEFRKELRKNWKEAFDKITETNRIVFIGYSLPKSDAYFRYFLKLAVSQAENLKEIKVVCKDKDKNGEIEENYKEFSKPARFKFLKIEWESIVPDFDIRSFNNPNSGNPPEKQSWWIEENDSEYGVFGWGTNTCMEQHEKGIFVD